jgi:hypothetical protein
VVLFVGRPHLDSDELRISTETSEDEDAARSGIKVVQSWFREFE